MSKMFPSRLSIASMLAYGTGMLGTQIFRDTPAVLLPLFMTTMLGVPAWLTGFVVLVPKVWLVLCDPLMGNLSDRAKARYGRAPFLWAGAILTCMGFISLFSFTGFTSPYVAALAIGVLFFIASTAFSAFSVPYLAMASELSVDPYERSKLLSYRLVFAVVGVVASVGLAQPIIFHLGGGAQAWQTMALIFGGASLISMLTTPIALRRKVAPDASAGSSAGWRSGLIAARKNKQYQLVTATHFIQSTSMGCGYTVLGFIFIYAVGKVDLILPFILLMAVGTFASQPLWLMLSRRMGKRSAFIAATVIWALVTASWVWVKPGDDHFMTLPWIGAMSSQEALVILRGIGVGIANSGTLLLIFSMLTDAIHAGQSKENTVDEGLLSGIFTAVEKLGFAIGPLIAGFALSLSGFQSSSEGTQQQSAEAINGIIMTYSVIPAIGLVISLLSFICLRPKQEVVLARTSTPESVT